MISPTHPLVQGEQANNILTMLQTLQLVSNKAVTQINNTNTKNDPLLSPKQFFYLPPQCQIFNYYLSVIHISDTIVSCGDISIR